MSFLHDPEFLATAVNWGIVAVGVLAAMAILEFDR